MSDHDSGVAIAGRFNREERDAFLARLRRDQAFVEAFLRLAPLCVTLRWRLAYYRSTINCMSGRR